MSDDDLAPLHPSATGFKLFRCLPDGTGRDYTGVEFARGWAGADQFRRLLHAVGYIRNSSAEPSYGVLDVLGADGDLLQDYDVPSAEAFAFIKRKLKLTVEPAEQPSAAKPGVA